MKIKKILFSSVLSLALLASAAPAFASEGQVAPAATSVKSIISVQASDWQSIPNTINQFANSFTDSRGVTWYLKGISYSGGLYYGLYQAGA